MLLGSLVRDGPRAAHQLRAPDCAMDAMDAMDASERRTHLTLPLAVRLEGDASTPPQIQSSASTPQELSAPRAIRVSGIVRDDTHLLQHSAVRPAIAHMHYAPRMVCTMHPSGTTRTCSSTLPSTLPVPPTDVFRLPECSSGTFRPPDAVPSMLSAYCDVEIAVQHSMPSVRSRPGLEVSREMKESMGWSRTAAASKARKEEEAQKLASANAANRERIKNTKAVVDDDLMDDAAGKALATYDPHHRGWQAKGAGA